MVADMVSDMGGPATLLERQVDGFLAKFTPEIETLARACWTKLREMVPGAVELVYDNHYSLDIGFAPSEKASESVLAMALFPRRVCLFFLAGNGPSDPHRLLKGSGPLARYIVLKSANDLDKPRVRGLIQKALAQAGWPVESTGSGKVIVKPISEKQRPRRPK